MTISIDARLSVDLRAPSAARRCVECLRDLVDENVLDDLRLLVSELVTNSYEHAGLGSGDSVDLSVESVDGVVRVEVRDDGRFLAPVAGNDSGWGLVIVDRVARRWGIETTGGTTLVWLELCARDQDDKLAGPAEPPG